MKQLHRPTHPLTVIHSHTTQWAPPPSIREARRVSRVGWRSVSQPLLHFSTATLLDRRWTSRQCSTAQNGVWGDEMKRTGSWILWAVRAGGDWWTRSRDDSVQGGSRCRGRGLRRPRGRPGPDRGRVDRSRGTFFLRVARVSAPPAGHGPELGAERRDFWPLTTCRSGSRRRARPTSSCRPACAGWRRSPPRTRLHP